MAALPLVASLQAMLVLLLLIAAEGRAQSDVDGFDPGANNTVETLAVQSNGKILVSGFFTALGGGTGQFQAHITVSNYTIAARAFCPRLRGQKTVLRTG
jgi:hypothetical protein